MPQRAVPVGWAVREGVQGQGCLDRQGGLVRGARGVPTASSQGKSGDTKEPLSLLMGPDVSHPPTNSLCPQHGPGMEPAQALGLRQGWPD